MKIVGVEAIPFAIPYTKPLRFASGEVHVAEHVLVRVHTDDGLTGVAEAPPRPYTYGETRESIVAVIDKIFAPQILGLSALEREVVHERLDRTVGNPAAKAALDMALWDILGQAASMPVSALLGGYTDRMRVSHMVGFAPADQMVAEAERMRDLHGITTFKVKVGRRPYTDDVAACRALRAALGPDVEHVVEEVAGERREGSKGTIEGPYYVAGAPALPAETTLPTRDGEPGTPLLFQGQVTSVNGTPLAGATVEIWHADDAGLYSQFAPGIPEWNLRGTVIADDRGRFAIRTVQPAPYQIPTDGSCGKLIAAAGWHAWRPAHLHLKVSAPGHQLVTTQLYFNGGEHVNDDIASAVKPELILSPAPATTGHGNEVTHDFVLDRA